MIMIALVDIIWHDNVLFKQVINGHIFSNAAQKHRYYGGLVNWLIP
jgi:hypothetical protein